MTIVVAGHLPNYSVCGSYDNVTNNSCFMLESPGNLSNWRYVGWQSVNAIGSMGQGHNCCLGLYNM